MANPTTNYGFVLPTATDLVTDLPADFDVALQGVDTRLKALNPETTLGDIAYASATANTNTRRAIGTTGQVLTVVGGVPAWASPSAGDTGPSFSAYRSGSTQSISAATYTKAAFNTEDWDSNSAYDNAVNYRFTPQVAGYYSVAVNGYVNYATADTIHANLYKNGSAYKYVASQNKANGGGDSIFGGACMVYLNGSSDYIELYFYSNNTATAIPTGSSNSQFSAALVRTA